MQIPGAEQLAPQMGSQSVIGQALTHALNQTQAGHPTGFAAQMESVSASTAAQSVTQTDYAQAVSRPGAIDALQRLGTEFDARRAASTQAPASATLIGSDPRETGPFADLVQRVGEIKDGMRNGSISSTTGQAMLLEVQAGMHETAFKVQLAGKMVEHGTTGTRNLLQTQA